MHVCHEADLGPEFIGWAADIAGTVTCVITPRMHDDEAVKQQVLELMRRVGAGSEPCSSTCPNASPRQEG